MKTYTKPSSSELKKRLSPLQFAVTQKGQTEKPFDNAYWDNKENGIYVDIVSGEPLFSSRDKYDSGTGWPSFTKPLEKNNIIEKKVRHLFTIATEVRSKHGDSHLGHVFNDGPKPTGLRYCINSAALMFIPADKLKEHGYPQYTLLFSQQNLQETAIFAGGCFWCMEEAFENLEGVSLAISGYTGGHKDNPTYEEVSAGSTGHVEAVQVTYDPSKITYQKLLDIFWHNIDPLNPNGQFCDSGEQYLSVIFYKNEQEKELAIASKTKLEKSGHLKGKIVTAIQAESKFYPAEEYHQNYSKKNPIRYKFYRVNCGRNKRLTELWSKKRR